MSLGTLTPTYADPDQGKRAWDANMLAWARPHLDWWRAALKIIRRARSVP